MSDLFDTAKLGIDAERFISSDVGKYIIAKAEHDANEAINKMKTVNTADSDAVSKIQSDLLIPDKIINWLSEVINEGQACEYQLREIESQ